MSEEQPPILFGEEGTHHGGWLWEWKGKGWTARVSEYVNVLSEVRWRAEIFVGDDERIEADLCPTAQAAATGLEDALRGIRDALADAFSIEEGCERCERCGSALYCPNDGELFHG